MDYITRLKKQIKECSDIAEKECLCILLKRYELRESDRLTDEMDKFFTWALNLLKNQPRPVACENYYYISQKTNFCKTYNVSF